MSILERLNERERKNQLALTSGEATQSFEERDNEVVSRFRQVMDSVTKYVADNDGGASRFGKMNFVLRGMVEELAEELNDLPEDTLSTYFQYIGHIIGWIGDGNTAVLPPELQTYAEDATQAKLESA